MVKHLMNEECIGRPQFYECWECGNPYWLVFEFQRCIPRGCEKEPINYWVNYVNDRTKWIDGRESEW